MNIYPNFAMLIDSLKEKMKYAPEVRGNKWQSIDVSKKPEMRMRELLNVSFQVSLAWNESIEAFQNDIQPNLPWAEDHFLERVGGEPLNPGVQWANWPWALSADKFRTENSKFSHTYMERYWPKEAGGHYHDAALKERYRHPLHGIRYAYGDLDDVVNHLLGDPLSRQAYLPVWFPEDTGTVHGERVPCTLGYHWIQRSGSIHTTYYIRSCDFVRHFRDDLYLSVRLTLWLLKQLREREPVVDPNMQPQDAFWNNVKPGLFTFHCVSMHMFQNDWQQMFGAQSVGAQAMGIDRIRNAQ